MKTINDFFDSQSKEQKEELFECVQRVFERDALKFAETWGYAKNVSALKIKTIQKASP
jgi:hypothetical protein